MNTEKEERIIEILLSNNYSYNRSGKIGILKSKGKVIYFPAIKLPLYHEIADKRQFGEDYCANCSPEFKD